MEVVTDDGWTDGPGILSTRADGLLYLGSNMDAGLMGQGKG